MKRDLRRQLRHAAAVLFTLGLTTLPGLAALAAVAYIVAAPRARGYRDARTLAVVGLTGGIALVLAPHVARSLVPWLGWLALGTTMVLVAQRWDRADARYAGIGFALGAVVTFGWELHQRLQLGIGRPTGFVGEPNFEAGLMVALLGALITARVLYESRLVRASLMVAAALSLGSLFLTGSRGAVLALVIGGLVWGVVEARHARWSRLLAWLGAAAAGVAAVAALVAYVHAGGTRNLIQDSGFEHGTLPWSLEAGSRIVGAPDASGHPGGSVVHLAGSKSGYQAVLLYRPSIPVVAGERLTLSLWARPDGAASFTFARVEARGADGSVLAYAGRRAWAPGAEENAGGYLWLPNSPAGKWRRLAFVLPPVPEGATRLTLMVATNEKGPQAYGDVDALQLEKGTSPTAYVPGPRPGLATLAMPLLTRWQDLQGPAAASGGRLTMWRFAGRLASSRPLVGYGPGTEVPLVKRYDATHEPPLPLNHLHSFYLKMLVEGGILTLAALLAWFGITASRLAMRIRVSSATAAPALATLVALLFQSVFDPVLSQPYIAGTVWLVVCAGLFADRVGRDQAEPGSA